MNSGLSATTRAAELSDDHIVALMNVGVDQAMSRTEQHANPEQRRTLCSILIVSFNTKDLTRACLLSLREWHADSEVIVVDNASRDGSADMIEQEFPEVRLLRLSHNIGFGRANNLAMKFSSHEVIVLLNSDTILQDNALSR